MPGQIYTGGKKFHVGEWFFVLNNKRPLSNVIERFLKLSNGFLVPLKVETSGTVVDLRTAKTSVKELAKKIVPEDGKSLTIFAGVNILTETGKILYDESSCIDKETKYYPFVIRFMLWKEEIYLTIQAKINVFLPKIEPRTSFFISSPYDPTVYTENNEKLSKLNVPLLNNLIKKIRSEFSQEIIKELDPEPGLTKEVMEKIGYLPTKDGIKIVSVD